MTKKKATKKTTKKTPGQQKAEAEAQEEAEQKRAQHRLVKMNNNDKINIALVNIEEVVNKLDLDTAQVLAVAEIIKFSTLNNIMGVTNGPTS